MAPNLHNKVKKDNVTFGPPRATRLRAEDDAELFRIAREEERPAATVLRMVFESGLKARRKRARQRTA